MGAVAARPPEVVPDEAAIRAGWSDPDAPALVDIVCVTYNQAAYVRDAMHGFLMQQTDFAFRILVHDDASDDGTAGIIRAFEARYPRIVECIVQTTNQGSRGVAIMPLLRPHLHAKYVARCDGDDYWLDPMKLARQVAYLEAHPECVISGHDAMIVDDQGVVMTPGMIARASRAVCDGETLMRGEGYVVTLSMVYRNLRFDPMPEIAWVMNRDSFFIAMIGGYGGSVFHADIGSGVYRWHGRGMWSALTDAQRKESAGNTYYWIHRYFKRIGMPQVAACWRRRWLDAAFGLRGSRGLPALIAAHVRQWLIRLRGPAALSRHWRSLAKRRAGTE